MNRILIAEDEAPIANLLRTALVGAGYCCDWAADGATAADLIETQPFDLALLDIMLPKANGYEVIIIADHGNADNAENADGTPNTAHSLNPVPFVYVTENKNARVEDGILADVAPSICHIMGLPQPAEMTGHDLLK